MGTISSILSGISAGLKWGLALFGAKNTAAAVQAKEGQQDEATLKKADGDLAKGSVADLGEDISQ
jgi:hypothetical protein